MNESLAFAFSVIALIIAVSALLLSIYNTIDTLATKRSTHQVQWQSIPTDEFQSAEDMAKVLNDEHINYDRDQI